MRTSFGISVPSKRADHPAEGGRAASHERRLANFIEFIGEGRGTRALAQAVIETKQRVEALGEEMKGLHSTREKVFRPPPVE